MQPTDKRTVTNITKKTTELLESVDTLTITDDEQLKGASGKLGEVKTIAKDLKAQKEAITKPLNAALKEVRALFKTPELNLDNTEQVIKQAILQYHEKQDAAAQKEIQKIENRVGEGRGHIRTETAMAKLANVEQAETTVKTETGGMQIKYGPEKVRITNVTTLIQAHPSLLLKERVLEAIRMELQAEFKAGIMPPAGAEVYRDKIVAGTTA